MRSENTDLLDIKRDYIFKLVFGAEKHKRVLLSFLNAIFEGDPYVKDLKITNPEIPKIFKKGKGVRLDIKADIGEERFVDIEIQVAGVIDASDRALQYLAAMMVDNSKSKKYLKRALPEGENPDYRYPKVIGVWIFASNVTNRKSAVNKAYMIFEKNELDDFEIMTKKAQALFIELLKFNPKKASQERMLDAWLTFLRDPSNKKVRKFEEIEEAYETLREVSADEKVRRVYRAILDKETDILNEKNRAVEIASQKAREEGEKLAKIESAKRFLEMKLPVEQVAKGTGLSLEEVEKLKEKLKQ